ncbi:diaminopropionate ammonia-lyase [Candidatus Pelagibacter sp.]|nr:diaminopropionate ammonia-lyase [Candidatus Pelagibacter sp.]MDC1482992.1 diaminopropionate ammonia-lyase [Pelagibacteraceae bacterium]
MKSILQKDLWSITSFLENKEYNFNKENILNHLPEKFIDEAIEAISSWDNYAPTPLVKLNKLNDELKFKNIYYKDEDKRFDLKSFKALGGAFAVYKIASEKKNITVSTATAGNHGRSVAWGAQRLGLNCKIFISEFVSESRAEAMRNLDAEVIRVKGNYDNSLKECIEQSNKNNWEIVQDVSWEGYKEVPKLIMAGYTIMVKEIIDEIDKNSITHVFLQAGVGGMAAAMIAGFAKLSKTIPQFIIVEPENADCVFQSIKNNKPTTVDIKKETVMGGMSCGDVSSIAWEILKNSANYCLTIPDEAISTAVALLAEKRLSNEKIIGGECAVPGVIALIGAFNNKEYLDKLKLNTESNILLFGCEGLTDNAMYQKLLSDGLQKI